MVKVSVARFTYALKQIGGPTENQRRFLEAHYDSPGHASTATVLAKSAGYKNYGGINLCYGRLAERIRASLGEKRRRTQ
jgi:hypothetical protein